MAGKKKTAEAAVNTEEKDIAAVAEKLTEDVKEEVKEVAENVGKVAKKVSKKINDTTETVKETVKKTTAKKTTELYVEYNGVQLNTSDFVDKAKAIYKADGNKVSDAKDIKLYLNTDEETVYFVINDDYKGSFSVK